MWKCSMLQPGKMDEHIFTQLTRPAAVQWWWQIGTILKACSFPRLYCWMYRQNADYPCLVSKFGERGDGNAAGTSKVTWRSGSSEMCLCVSCGKRQTGLNGEEQSVSAPYLRQNLSGEFESFSICGISGLVLFDGPVHEAHVQSCLSAHPLTWRQTGRRRRCDISNPRRRQHVSVSEIPPVKMSSLARVTPTVRGSRWLPPAGQTTSRSTSLPAQTLGSVLQRFILVTRTFILPAPGRSPRVVSIRPICAEHAEKRVHTHNNTHTHRGQMKVWSRRGALRLTDASVRAISPNTCSPRLSTAGQSELCQNWLSQSGGGGGGGSSWKVRQMCLASTAIISPPATAYGSLGPREKHTDCRLQWNNNRFNDSHSVHLLSGKKLPLVCSISIAYTLVKVIPETGQHFLWLNGAK